ncbi:MAG TPA: Na(+)/H(+) antiporter subunit D [Bacillota bacterium]|nr:Na(+)/H(+) antiporter subunit D [Bacillota bacterium]
MVGGKTPVIHPTLIFFAGAALLPFLKGRARKVLIILVPLAALAGTLFVRANVEWFFPFPGFSIIPFQADRLSLFVERIFVLIGLLIVLYSLHVEQKAYPIVSFLYIGSSLGVVFAGDFITFFMFWEMLSITPAVLIWLKRDEGSFGAGLRYLLMHLVGGGIMLAGILLHFSATGSMAIAGLAGLPFALILTAIGFKAAFIPLHTWLPDAYPKASFTASVLLSVFTTKAAVYALARSFPGVEVVAYMGGVMGLYGVTLALRQSNARKLLSYHIISQVGYMVAGIGIGTPMGIDGGLSHVWNHILYKALLFMCIGAAIYRTDKHDLTELGGLLKKMPITTAACIIGALSISGVPLFNGFVSKAMIYEAAGNHAVLYWMLKLTAAGTFLSFCKFTYFGFLRNKEVEVREAPLTMTIPMVIVASLCILGGVYPDLLTNILPYQSSLRVFTPAKLLDAMLVLGVAGAAFIAGMRLLAPHGRETRDFDYLYRRVARGFLGLWRNPSAVDVRSLESALLLVAVMLSLFLLYVAMSFLA